MESMGEDNNQQELNSSPPESKSPQDELEALLQQSRVNQPRKSGIVLPQGGGKKTNWLVIFIAILAVVLLAATIGFLVWGVGANKGTAIFYLNEDGVTVAVDGRDFGAVDSGFEASLSVGTHSVTVAKDGFLEMQEGFELVRGETKEIYLELLPIPFIETVLGSTDIKYARLSLDGSEASFFDSSDNRFKSVDMDTGKVVELFEGRSFSQKIVGVSWSVTGRAALVRLTGVGQLQNMIDNRKVLGAYIPLGEQPEQGTANYNGINTWLFDDTLKNVSGWRPVLLNESVRETAFGANGGSIVYLYDPVGDEYSLVKADPDGAEWERVVLELPQFETPILWWSPDDRYLLIEDGATTYLVDVLAGVVESVLADRVEDSGLAFSPDGDRVAYVVEDDNGARRLNVFDMVQNEAADSDALADIEMQDANFVWTSGDTVLVTLANKTFREIDINDGSEKLIPFVGQDTDFEVIGLEYSRLGRMLLLETDKGLFKMQV
ncbi:MAG: PEGA domain-containing protein [Patescibacteria group bacterium]|nr:PEGA domain-containing protein [Patescibacteria group bacterium]